MQSRELVEGRRRLIKALAALFGAGAVGGAMVPGTIRAQSAAMTRSARSFGAKGDGVADDTAALQRAIDALGPRGGVLVIEQGQYMIDGARALNVRSHVTLQFAEGAILRCMPNALSKSSVLTLDNVDDVRINGGVIEGDRDRHSGTDGEWGHGISVLSSTNVSIDRTRITGCWGDGIYVGPSGSPSGKPSSSVFITNVVADRNRRQGLSLTAVQQVRVRGCTFSNTQGTAPACGIDIEPGKLARADDVTIENCTCSGNDGSGIAIDENVTNLKILGSALAKNRGYGLLITSASDVAVTGNQIRANGLNGIKVRHSSKRGTIDRNTFAGNFASVQRRAIRSITGSGLGSDNAAIEIDIDSRSVQAKNNQFED